MALRYKTRNVLVVTCLSWLNGCITVLIISRGFYGLVCSTLENAYFMGNIELKINSKIRQVI